MRYVVILVLPLWILLCGFNFPDEKKHLAQKVADITVTDANGNSYKLYSLLRNKPLIISPVYTRCYSTCAIVSNGVQAVVNQLGTLGKDFNMLSFSFDTADKAEDLTIYELRWKMDGNNWRTVTASDAEIKKLLTSIGYEYDYNASTQQYNHPSILVVLTPSGKISRYIYGINPSKKDVNLAVIEAAAEQSRPGLIQGFYLRCFGYDPILKTYKMDWRFIISTSAGLLMISLVSGIFIRSFIISKHHDG
ncbi:MAG: SCO family protein [Bacteroidetes bacterium]|nr:SCO family protein [Bacteroidota bacterium]